MVEIATVAQKRRQSPTDPTLSQLSVGMDIVIGREFEEAPSISKDVVYMYLPIAPVFGNVSAIGKPTEV